MGWCGLLATPSTDMTAASLRCRYIKAQCRNQRAPAIALKCNYTDQQTTVWAVCCAPLCCAASRFACTLTLIEDATNLAVHVRWCALCAVEMSLAELRCPQVGHFTLVSHLDPVPHAAERACLQVLEQDRDRVHTRIASSSHLTETPSMGCRAEGCQTAALALSELHAQMSSGCELIFHQLRVASAHARQIRSDKSTLCNTCDVYVRTRTGKALLLLTNFLQTARRELACHYWPTDPRESPIVAWQSISIIRV